MGRGALTRRHCPAGPHPGLSTVKAQSFPSPTLSVGIPGFGARSVLAGCCVIQLWRARNTCLCHTLLLFLQEPPAPSPPPNGGRRRARRTSSSLFKVLEAKAEVMPAFLDWTRD